MSDKKKSFLPIELLKEIEEKNEMTNGVFPPNVAAMTPHEFIDYKKGDFLKFRFPILEKYNNPFGITFGGIYGMFFDSVFGPFSGLESSGPTSSLDMNITYIKSISIRDEYVDVTATLSSISKSFLIMSGEMHSKSGKLAATATSRMMIMDISRMKTTQT